MGKSWLWVCEGAAPDYRFQTGETFRRAPLIDYQHPHDLFMGLDAEYSRPVGRATILGAVDLAGSPSLGPGAFMHRASAIENPQAPLSHHHMDSTHITPGVVRGGIAAGDWRADASWFRGREPDEKPARHRPGRAGFDRRAAVVEARTLVSRGLRRDAWLAAFGQNREIHGNLEAYLFEANARIRSSSGCERDSEQKSTPNSQDANFQGLEFGSWMLGAFAVSGRRPRPAATRPCPGASRNGAAAPSTAA